MRKIGLLLTGRPGGGAFQYAQSVLDAVLGFPSSEYEIVIAYRDPVWQRELPPAMRTIRLRDSLWSRALNRLWHEARLSIALWRKTAARLDGNMRALVAEGCDLWICPNQDHYAFRAEIPALSTVHDLMHRYERSFAEVSEGGEYEQREFHFRETCRWSSGVLVDSEVGRQQLVESYGIAADRVFVMPYIAPRYIYQREKRDDEAVAARYGLPPKYFFYPAQFYAHKNHTALIAAVDRMRGEHPDVALVLAGAPGRNGESAISEMIASRGLASNVTILGYVPDTDMVSLYARARALVMPTLFGPTNIPQLEAFATGCPVATSNIYGIAEQTRGAALLFDPRSEDEIHDCLVRLWTDDTLCAELSAKGLEHARSWGRAQFRDRLLGIVEELAA